MDMNNVSNLQSFEISLRSGWKDEEKLMLWDEVKKAQKIGAPLKRVFETVAVKTGRKPNSVRNYYYMKVKETGETLRKPSTFTPFTKEEIYMLLHTLLAAGAKGESVRGASLKLADGDKTLMLRYQNKYRSLIKSGRPLVEKVMADMDAVGERYLSPYDKAANEAQAGKDSSYISERVVKTLMASDIDVKSFFKGLAKIAMIAESTQSLRHEMQMVAAQNESIRNENDALAKSNRDLGAQLSKEIEKSRSAKALFQQLMSMGEGQSENKQLEKLSGIGEWLLENTQLGADAL